MSIREAAQPVSDPPVDVEESRPIDAGDPTLTKPIQQPTKSLRRLAVQGSAWTFVGMGVGHALKLISSVILSYLLAPEVFGLMLLVSTFAIALQMFSDVGILPSIVQDKRGDDPDFLNTAWTIQIGRGFLLALASCAIAWPAAAFYEQPMLMWLLPVTGFGAIIMGFNSTSLCTLQRHLEVGKLTIFEFTTNALQVVAIIVLAAILENVWALALGGLVGPLLRLIISHTILATHRNRLRWDREAVGRLFRFGRWIFLSTVLTFVVMHGDKLILGKLFNETDLGLYAYAYALYLAVEQGLRQLAHKVLFPLYARLADTNRESLKEKMFRVRWILMLVTLPPYCVLMVFGDEVVQLLYAEEFHGAGWMLRILAVGGIFASITLSCSPVLLAVGDSFRSMLVLIVRSFGLFAAMWIGYHFWGATGVVAGVAAATVVSYPALAWAVKRYGVWTPWLDTAGVVGSAGLVGLGFLLKDALGS